MSTAKSDFPVRDAKVKAMRQLRRVLIRHKRLDDMLSVLRRTELSLSRETRQYNKELKSVMLSFFSEPVFDDLADNAHKEFMAAVGDVLQRGKPITQSLDASIRQAIKRNHTRFIENIVNQLTNNIETRNRFFRSFALSSTVESGPATVTINGKTFSVENLQESWGQLNRRFGRADTIQFRDGKNFPIQSWLDQRSATVTQDIQNLTTFVDAQFNGIHVLRVSSHAASDSCAIHEGKYLVLNESARDELIEQHPDAAKLIRALPTFDDLVQDGTHLFKPNCKHRLLPAVIQFESTDVVKSELESRPPAKVAKGFKESQFKRAA